MNNPISVNTDSNQRNKTHFTTFLSFSPVGFFKATKISKIQNFIKFRKQTEVKCLQIALVVSLYGIEVNIRFEFINIL
jgi:hypothetical protein